MYFMLLACFWLSDKSQVNGCKTSVFTMGYLWKPNLQTADIHRNFLQHCVEKRD
jgi:hypothetical protein